MLNKVWERGGSETEAETDGLRVNSSGGRLQMMIGGGACEACGRIRARLSVCLSV